MDRDLSHTANVNARVILIIGKPGRGKTHLAKSITSKANRLIAIDPLGEWGDVAIIGSDWDTVLDMAAEPKFRIAVEIEEPPNEILDTVSQIVRDEEVRNCWVVTDELSVYFRRGQIPSDNIQGLVRFGRRENIDVILISQRAMDCPIDIRGMLTDVYAFQFHEPQDVQYLGDIIGDRQGAKKVMDLRGHQHYHWDLRGIVDSSESDPESEIEIPEKDPNGEASSHLDSGDHASDD